MKNQFRKKILKLRTLYSFYSTRVLSCKRTKTELFPPSIGGNSGLPEWGMTKNHEICLFGSSSANTSALGGIHFSAWGSTGDVLSLPKCSPTFGIYLFKSSSVIFARSAKTPPPSKGGLKTEQFLMI